MTGYGKGIAENDRLVAEAEVKSVNNRYLEISLKIPSALFVKEYELRELIRNKISRGKLTVVLQVKNNKTGEEIPALDKTKLKNYLSLLKDVRKTAKLTEKIKLEHLLMAKDLFSTPDVALLEDEFVLVKKALDEALNDLLKMRKNEGNELAKDMLNRLKFMEDKIDLIEVEMKNSVVEYYGKLKERIKVLIEDTSIQPERLELELALIADKADITEECVRLRSHIKFFRESLSNDGEPGRKLNFICQEMNRETNTISSKTIATSITHHAVLMKEEIEKIREQIQNLE
jgi:uncharacterized protein (TIGR00255 family)